MDTLKPNPDSHLVYVLVDMGLTLDNSPVFQSQVLDKIRIQREARIQVTVITTIDNPSRFEKVINAPLRELGVPVYSFPDKGLLRNLFSARRDLRFVFSKNGPIHIYARGIWGAIVHWMAFPLRGPDLIYDFRGDVVAEAAALGASRMRQGLLKSLCRMAFSRATTVLTVSKASTAILASEYGVSNCVVFPSAVDAGWFQRAASNRDPTREALRVEVGDILLVYAGSLSHYQMIPEMLETWRELSRLPHVHFLLLTSQQPASGRHPSLDLVSEIPRLTHASVPRSEMPSYLAAADIGFLLREEDPLNVVASPVKFGEYLAAGLAVVTSPGLGDVSQMVRNRNLGVLVRPKEKPETVFACLDLVRQVVKDRDGFRLRARRAVEEEQLDLRSHAEMWLSLLRNKAAQ